MTQLVPKSTTRGKTKSTLVCYAKPSSYLSQLNLLCFQYEWNARTQVTMWYDITKTNQSQLHDYGKVLDNKQLPKFV